VIVAVGAFAVGQGMLCLSHIWVYAFYLQNVWIFKKIHLGSPLDLSHFWSLAVEEQFYLVWPFLIYRSKSLRSAKAISVIVFLASLAFRLLLIRLIPNPVMLFDSIAARGGELAAGAYLAISYRDGSWETLQKIAPAALLLSLIVLSTLFTVDPFQVGISAGTFLWSSFLIIAITDGSIIRSAMEMGWLRWIGTISYGVYVFHVLFIHQYGWLADNLFPLGNLSERLALKAVFDVVGTLLIASASFYLFEKPILKFRKKFKPTVVGAER
jgi:peptidoglycan/LPS O-acetylase OafA/YrhL